MVRAIVIESLQRSFAFAIPFYLLAAIVSSKRYLTWVAEGRCKWLLQLTKKEKYAHRLKHMSEYIESIHIFAKLVAAIAAVCAHIIIFLSS